MGAMENIADFSRTLIKRMLRSGELVRGRRKEPRKMKARDRRERLGFNTGPSGWYKK